ncbi:MAG: hypothetical protein ACTHXJ_00075, partial [Mesonia sp.]
MRKIISLIALSLAFLAFTPEMNAQDSKTAEEVVRAETLKQVDELSETLGLDANDQTRLHRSLYAYNINTEVHIKNVTEKNDAYYANNKKFE